MIRTLFSEILVREAARLLTRHRIKNERAEIRATARQLCEEMGRPIPRALRG